MLTRLAKALLPERLRSELAWAKQSVRQGIADRRETARHGAAWRQSRLGFPDSADPAAWYRLAEREFGICQRPGEVCALIERLREASPVTAGEIGVRDGGNSLLFIHALPSLQRYLGMDLQVRNRAKLRYLARDGMKAGFMDADSHHPCTPVKVERWLGGQLFDLLFIDGDHRYEGVRRDFLDYGRLVRPGGLIAFHDICGGDASTEDEQPGQPWAGGVPRFWREIREQYEHVEFVEDWHQTGFGIGLIVKPVDG